MANRRLGGLDRGSTNAYPLAVSDRPDGQTSAFKDTVFRQCPWTRLDYFEDFDGEQTYYEETVPFIRTNSNADLAQWAGTSSVARAYYYVPRSGIITAVGFCSEDGRTQSGAAFETLTGLNLLAAGTGSTSFLDTTAHVNTTDSNALAINGGTNLTAKVPYALALHGTAANLRVAEGDLLELTSTSSGNPTVMDAVFARFRILTTPQGVKPLITRTAGSPLVAVTANTANGICVSQLDATNEAQVAGIYRGDQLTQAMSRGAFFQAYLKVSGVAANTRFVFGLGSAYTATLDNTTYNAWFRLEGNSLALKAETDDNTTDSALTDCNFTLTADTFYLFTIVGLNDGTVDFYVDNNRCANIAAAAFSASSLMQPIALVQKDSGTGTQSMTVDMWRCGNARF